jgi:hypothetical protein
MVAVPFRFKAVVVDLINPKQGKRCAHGMQWAGLNNFQNGLRRLRFELRDQFRFPFCERLHPLSIANGTSSVRDTNDKEDANFVGKQK